MGPLVPLILFCTLSLAAWPPLTLEAKTTLSPNEDLWTSEMVDAIGTMGLEMACCTLIQQQSKKQVVVLFAMWCSLAPFVSSSSSALPVVCITERLVHGPAWGLLRDWLFSAKVTKPNICKNPLEVCQVLMLASSSPSSSFCFFLFLLLLLFSETGSYSPVDQ